MAHWLKDPWVKTGQPEMQSGTLPTTKPGSSPPKGFALTLELPKVLSRATQMLRAVGLQGLESRVLKEAEILQAKETLKGRQN